MRDLLNPSRAHDSLPVRWSSTNGFYVENVFMTECENVEDMMVVLDEGPFPLSVKLVIFSQLIIVQRVLVSSLCFWSLSGLQNRQVGTHAMNDHSSRSHTILTVYLQSEAVSTQSPSIPLFIFLTTIIIPLVDTALSPNAYLYGMVCWICDHPFLILDRFGPWPTCQ